MNTTAMSAWQRKYPTTIHVSKSKSTLSCGGFSGSNPKTRKPKVDNAIRKTYGQVQSKGNVLHVDPTDCFVWIRSRIKSWLCAVNMSDKSKMMMQLNKPYAKYPPCWNDIFLTGEESDDGMLETPDYRRVSRKDTRRSPPHGCYYSH